MLWAAVWVPLYKAAGTATEQRHIALARKLFAAQRYWEGWGGRFAHSSYHLFYADRRLTPCTCQLYDSAALISPAILLSPENDNSYTSAAPQGRTQFLGATYLLSMLRRTPTVRHHTPCHLPTTHHISGGTGQASTRTEPVPGLCVCGSLLDHLLACLPTNWTCSILGCVGVLCLVAAIQDAALGGSWRPFVVALLFSVSCLLGAVPSPGSSVPRHLLPVTIYLPIPPPPVLSLCSTVCFLCDTISPPLYRRLHLPSFTSRLVPPPHARSPSPLSAVSCATQSHSCLPVRLSSTH